jgi:hypothetical protein
MNKMFWVKLQPNKLFRYMMLDDAEFVRQVKILFTSLIGMEEGLDPLADSIIAQYNEDHDRFSKAGKKGGEISAKSSLAQASLKPASSQNQADKIRVDKNRENTKDNFVRNRTARAEVEELFEDFRKRYPGRKLGLKAEFDNFLRKAGNQSEIIARGLITALEYETSHREKIRLAGAFLPEWKNLKTWVNNRCWEQEFPVEVQAQERRTNKQQSQDRLMQELMELNQMREAAQ